MLRSHSNGGLLNNIEIDHMKTRINRFLILLAGLITPVFSHLWTIISKNAHVINRYAALITVYYLSLYMISYKSKFIVARLHTFLYGSYYAISGILVYVVYSSNFYREHSILLLLAVVYTILSFNSLKPLLYYWIFLSSALFIALIVSYRNSVNVDINYTLIGITYLVLSVIASFNIIIRINIGNALFNSYEDYQRLLDESPDGIIVLYKMNIIYANPVIIKILDKQNKDEVIGQPVYSFLDKDEYRNWDTDDKSIIKNLKEGYYEKTLYLPNNKCLELEIATRRTKYKGKDAILITLKDISERKIIERKLLEAEQRYRNLVEESMAGVLINQNNKIVYINPYMENLLGYSRNEICNIDFMDLITPEARDKIADIIEKMYSGTFDKISNEAPVKDKDGKMHYFQFQLTKMIYNGSPALLGTAIDITERKETELKMRNMAYYDSLTKLPNRYILQKYLVESIKEYKQSGIEIGVLFVDLDKFKMVNDTLGHKFGDLVLLQASKKLKKSIREEDFVARYGGDEFIIVIKNLARGEIRKIVQRIIDEFKKPFKIKDSAIYITPSIGISMCPKDSEDPETLIRYADTAMYFAKEQGRNLHKFYYAELNKEITRKMNLANDLRSALDNNEFVLYFQPIVDLDGGKMFMAEALIRWVHPEFGLISPSEFIPLAEETGQIIPIGEWVIRTSCKQVKMWHDLELPKIRVSINVSRNQLNDGNFVNAVSQILHEEQLEPKYLEFEITESILQNIAKQGSVIEKLKAIGVSISIDDFGVGYSSFSVLQNMDINSLKLDMSFTKEIVENPKAAAIIKTIVDMGQLMNLKIVAEGIETEKQLNSLKSIKCGAGQGYLFSKPLPAEAFTDYLSSNHFASTFSSVPSTSISTTQ